jgi:hypothetical protein
MRYVAEALTEDGQSDAAIIGIASLGVINKRDNLLEADGGYVEYGNPDNSDRPHVSLDQNHSHYILVDDGSVGSFGVEVGKHALATAASHSRRLISGRGSRATSPLSSHPESLAVYAQLPLSAL